LKKVFGIDIYSVNFPKKKGYQIYKTKNKLEILLIRLENLTQYAPVAFKEFLNVDEFTLENSNVSETKFYYPIYRKFISEKFLSQVYVEKLYNSKYARHFYTEEELENFKRKWL